MKVILLAPDAADRRLVSDVLTGENHDVLAVESAAELFSAQQSVRQSIVVVAAEVVHREGLRLAQHLRPRGGKQSCAILALAGEDDAERFRDLVAAGVDDVLGFPRSAADIRLRAAIAEHRLRRGLRREHWFESLVALGSTVYLVIDRRGMVLYASPTVSAISGWTADEMVGKRVFEFLLADDIDRALKLLDDLIARPGGTAQTLFRFWFRDGSAGVVEATGVNRLDDPLIEGIIITAKDMTRQWAVESALELTENRYRALIESTREGIAICDPDESLVFANPALAEVLGYRRDELVGMNLCELTDEATFLKLRKATAERRAGVSSRDEIHLYTKRGELRRFALSATPLFDNAGQFSGTLGLLVDITERKRAEEKLRRSEQRYRLIAENVSDVIWTHHLVEPVEIPATLDEAAARGFADRLLRQLQTTYVSPSVSQLLGYSVAEAMALEIAELLTADSVERVRRTIVAILAAHARSGLPAAMPKLIEIEYRTKDGGTRWGEITGTTFFDDKGRFAGTLSVTRNVTERKHVERALQESEFRLRRLIENMPDLVILVDRAARIQYANRGIGSFEPGGLVGQTGLGFLREECQGVYEAALGEALVSGEVQNLELQDVSGCWWACRLVPLLDEGLAPQVMIIGTDVTEQRRAAEEVRREQDLLRQLIEFHERDRRLLAFELHDGFAQHLTGAMMSLEAATQWIASNPEKALGPIREGTRLLRESIAESRRLVGGLRPPVLDQFGIVPAVEHLVQLNRREGKFEIEFVSRGRPRRLASPLENAIFRIVQETLTNARRHSHSSRAMVELRLADEGICLTVQDWGTGFDVARIREGRFGLQGVRERARLLGGCAEVTSAAGEGTTVQVRLPMVERRADEDSGIDEQVAWPGGLDGDLRDP
ncbi:MAG: PAS domain S-box protein [Pirellulaceae bacterium]|jgi:PAS domain S-box-containing protein|nr:PAS domain S-box protein [Thermoguttaceae bacterium]NLZ03124.1 PAS domain S-box protein [Pirellulaceae bacterium]